MKELIKNRNGLTKERSQDISVVAFKPSKQSKPKRLNAISFIEFILFQFGYVLGYVFWLVRNLLNFKILYTILTKLTKKYSKTNIVKYIGLTGATRSTTPAYMLLNIVMRFFRLG